MRWCGPRGDVDPRPTIGLAAVVTVLAVAGAIEPWPGLLHLVALTPLGTITDLQLLLVHAPGWPWFVVGVIASVVMRSLLLAATLRSLHRRGLLSALGYHLTVLPLAAVAAVLLYGAGAVLFYLLFWLGLAVSLALVVLTGSVPWTAPSSGGVDGAVRPGRWERVTARVRPGTVAAYLVPLTVLGMLSTSGELAQITAVPLSAMLTLLTVHVLRDPTLLRRSRRVLALLPSAGAIALVAMVLSGPAGPPEAAGDGEREGSVLLMSGIDSASGSGAVLEIDPVSLGWDCESTRYYSYAGPGDGQPRRDAACAIDHGAPYRAGDTLRQREEQVGFLEAQVGDMEPPVTVVAHSQAAWLAWEAAAGGHLPVVEHLVVLGAFGENPIAYPPEGAREPGAVGRASLDLIADMPRPGGTTVFEPDSPLGREWLARPDAVHDVLATPLPPGVRALSVSSSFDLPLAHSSEELAHAVDACPVPVVHPNLPYAPEFAEQVQRFLDERPSPGCGPWRTAPGPLLRHFSAPPS